MSIEPCTKAEFEEALREDGIEQPHAQLAGTQVFNLNSDTCALLCLLADIREACRDRGHRMQDELVRYIRELTNKAELWDEYQGKAPATYLAGPAQVDMGGVVFRIPEGKVAELRGFDIHTGKPEAMTHG